MKLMRKLTIGVTLIATITGLTSVNAGAEPADTGWDDVADRPVGQGSDTTYKVIMDLSLTYNEATGCEIQQSDIGSAPNFTAPLTGDCRLGANQPQTVTSGNWDHDVVVNKFPTGSSQGVKEMLDGRVDFARSSRPPKTSGETGSTFWGFAKDGITIIAMGGRAPVSITQAQAVGIWNCSITNWNQISGSLPSAPIHPYGMNPSSGTKASMDSFLGFDANSGSCVKKLATNVFPTENDVKQLIASPAAGTTLANSIWWGSFAEFKAFAYKRQSAEYLPINGVEISNGSIADNSYPIKRYVYHVAPNASVAPAASGATTGADSGKAGAVREFTEWLCKPKAAHTVSDFTGQNLYDANTSTIVNAGYQRIPTPERTNGGVCAVAVAP